MTYLEYQARQFVDRWYADLTMEQATLVSPLLRYRLEGVVASTWKEEGRYADPKL